MNPNRIFDNPDKFLWQFVGPDAQFIDMNQASYRDSIFCDARICRPNGDSYNVKLTELFDICKARGKGAPASSYIFHMAHCGSTLLARALDAVKKNIVYREPYVLRQLGVIAAAQYGNDEIPEEWQQAFLVSTTLLSRRYHSEGPAIIKANVPVNFMIPQLMGVRPDNKAIVLYLRLEDYLLSILKSSNHRNWVKHVTAELSNGIEAVANISIEERKRLSVPQAAACLWMVQMSLYTVMLDKFPAAKSLDAELFFGQPKQTLLSAFEFFGNPQTEETVDKIVNSVLFSRYSKDPRYSYTNEKRIADKNRLRSTLEPQISEAQDWVSKHLEACPIPESLPGALFSGSAGF